MVTEWLAASAAVASAVVAVVSIAVGRRGNSEALAAQAEEMRASREHERTLAHDNRVWDRRADLYARIVEAVRSYMEDHAGVPAPQDPTLTRLAAETEVVASKAMSDLLSEFVYNDPPLLEKIDLWTEIQAQARAELVGGSDHPR